MQEAPSTFTEEREQALLELMDDPSPSVRQAILAYLGECGPRAASFLERVARGSDRDRARGARQMRDLLRLDGPAGDFRRFIRSLNYELETGALMLARTVAPDLDAGLCCGLLDEMAQRCNELIVEPSGPREQCRVISRVLFHEEGFSLACDEQAEPDGLLDRTLEVRRGGPLSLGILFLLLAQRLGLELKPAGLPSRLLVGGFWGRTPFFVDPCAQGLIRGPHDAAQILRAAFPGFSIEELAPAPVREVLVACCTSLHAAFAARADPIRARLFGGFVEEFSAACADTGR